MSAVEKEIALAPSLDAQDYDPIQHLNVIFSHPSTLSAAPDTAAALRRHQYELDRKIAHAVSTQAQSDAESVRRIKKTKADLAELFEKVESVRKRAIATEQAITEMTADIKQLDNTKKNLTLSMTALKRLQMLTTAYDQLKGLSSTRQYKECAQLLEAVLQLMAHFKSYRSIDQIAVLSRNVSDLQRELLEQVCEDFEITFTRGEAGQKRVMLSEGCLVMDALGENTRSRLITWYCNTQLREYRQLFRGSEEAGSLDNIAMRYSWFKRLLKAYDNEHRFIFPPAWKVDETLSNAFCEGTREDFKGILSRAAQRPDGSTIGVDLLLQCLQETLDFEHLLEKKFSTASRASMDTVDSSDERSPIFTHAISEAFEPYLNVWVEAQDKHLASLIPKYRGQPLRPAEEDFNPQMVAASSTELFNIYRLTLNQCARLSPGARLVDLTKVFAKYLDQYAQQILWFHLSERPSGQTPSKVPILEDMVLVLNTADYCYNTCLQLEERIKAKIEPEFRANVDLQSQGEAFMGVAAATVRALVRRMEIDLESCWREMRNVAWAKIENVTDQSSYVSELLRKVKSHAVEILGMLHKPQYARAFCDNVVDMVCTAYLANVFQCKPIAEVGAEQMLLDVYTLKQEFEKLPSLASTATHQKPASIPALYLKRVGQATSRIDLILKTLQVRPSPPEALVQAYLIHIADKSDTNFRKIVELKGLKKQEQAQLLELFQAHRASPKHGSLAQSSPILTPLFVVGAGGGGTSGTTGGSTLTASAIPSGLGTHSQAASLSTSSLPARFDPSNFGNALLTAARDGVDRFGGGSSGGGGGGGSSAGSGVGTPSESRLMSPPPPANRRALSPNPNAEASASTGNLNENLRNIGKFFKRDIGGFGGRFGRSEEGG